MTVRTALEGWPVELADTAGLRVTDDAVEALGVARARESHQVADLVVLVLDRSEPLNGEDRRLCDEFPVALRVASKSDLPPSWSEDGQEALAVSAARGDGIPELVAAIGRRLVPGPELERLSGVPFENRQVRRLRQARALMVGGRPRSAGRVVARLLRPVAPPTDP